MKKSIFLLLIFLSSVSWAGIFSVGDNMGDEKMRIGIDGQGKTITNVSSITATGDITAGRFLGDGSGITNVSSVDTACRVSTGSINSDLQSHKTAVALSTDSLRTDLNATAISTGVINTDLQNSKTSIAASTTSLRSDLTAIAISTGTLITIDTSQNITGVKTFASSVTITSVDGLNVASGRIVAANGTAANPSYIFSGSGSSGIYYKTTSPTGTVFVSGGNAIMLGHSTSGNAFIGGATTTPTHKLHIGGGLRVASSATIEGVEGLNVLYGINAGTITTSDINAKSIALSTISITIDNSSPSIFTRFYLKDNHNYMTNRRAFDSYSVLNNFYNSSSDANRSLNRFYTLNVATDTNINNTYYPVEINNVIEIPSNVSIGGHTVGLYIRNHRSYETDIGTYPVIFGLISAAGHKGTSLGGTAYTNEIYCQRIIPYAQSGQIGTLYGISIDAPYGGYTKYNKFYPIYQSEPYGTNYFGSKTGFGTPNAQTVIHASATITTAPYYVMIVDNGGSADLSRGIKIKLGDNSASTHPEFITFFRGDNTAIGGIRKDGTSNVAYDTSSDIRLKENILPAEKGLTDIMKMRVVEFNWYDDLKGDKNIGLLAQEIYDIYPACVYKPILENEYWRIDYSKLVPLLIKAIQDQQKNIETLQQRIEILENR